MASKKNKKVSSASIGIIAVVVIILSIVVYWRFRKRRARNESAIEDGVARVNV